MVVPLTRGKVALVSLEDYEKVRGFKWFVSASHYAVRNSPPNNGKRHTIWLHKFIMDAG
jgi:hypothetical protein